MVKPIYTPPYGPDKKFSENYNSVFVFGSNLGGYHLGGAALIALKKYGAVMGTGFGWMGPTKLGLSCYAIPTKDVNLKSLRFTEVAYWVDKFNDWTITNSNKFGDIFVTKIGCGLAGFTEKEIAPLFRRLWWPSNVILPTGW